MNAITKTSNYSLSKPASNKDLGLVIAGLFATLHHADNGKASKSVLSNFIDVLSDIPQWAVEEVSEEYRKGILGDGRFVPMAAEFSKHCRERVQRQAARQKHLDAQEREQAQIRSEIASRKMSQAFHAKKTDESRKRVAEKLKQAQETIAQAKLEMEAHELQKRKGQPSQHEITQKHFFDQGRKALLNAMERHSR